MRLGKEETPATTGSLLWRLTWQCRCKSWDLESRRPALCNTQKTRASPSPRTRGNLESWSLWVSLGKCLCLPQIQTPAMLSPKYALPCSQPAFPSPCFKHPCSLCPTTVPSKHTDETPHVLACTCNSREAENQEFKASVGCIRPVSKSQKTKTKTIQGSGAAGRVFTWYEQSPWVRFLALQNPWCLDTCYNLGSQTCRSIYV